MRAEENATITMDMIKEDTNLLSDANLSIRKDKAFNILLLEDYYMDYEIVYPSLKLDKDIVLAYLANSLFQEPIIPKELVHDHAFILSVIKKVGMGLEYATKDERADKELVLLGLRNEAKAFKVIDKDLKENEDFIKEALQVNGLILEFLDKKYRANKEFVLLAIEEDVTALKYATSMIKSDEAFIRKAVKLRSDAFRYAHSYLRQDKKFVLKLLREGYTIIFYVDECLQKDREVLEEAIKYDEDAWNYFDENLTEDRDFILAHLKENFSILLFLDENWTKNREIITMAVKKDASNLAYADESLRKDKKFLWHLVKVNREVVEEIDSKMWNDNEFLVKVLKETGFGLKYATKEQQNDIELVVKALKYDGYSLEFANDRFKKSKLMVLLSLDSYAYSLTFADESLKADKEFMKEAIKVNSYALEYASETLQEDKALARLAIARNPKALEGLAKLKRDKLFISELLKENFNVLPYVDESLKNDADLIALSKAEREYHVSIEVYLIYLSILLLVLFFYFKLFKKENKKYLLWITSLLLLVALLLNHYNIHGVYRMPYLLVDKSHKFGLEPTPCHFRTEDRILNVECYNMHVPEIYGDENSRVITFPVRVFRSTERFSFKTPILHLGAGGPGADMGLNSSYALDYWLKEHDDFSINQGRDFFIIDPRGAGLSKPLLNCGTYADNFLKNLKKSLTEEESIELYNKDYETCVNKFKKEGVDFNGYNSLAVANDINLLSKSLNIDKWVLFGVSYSTTYAMFVAKKYPNIVEKMILDSSCFPDLKLDHNYVMQSMDMYNALYTYKDKLDKNSSKTDDNSSQKMQEKLWKLEKKFNQNPLDLNYLGLKLDGESLIESLLEGVYGTKIFKDLPKIVRELESNKSNTFLPYFKEYLDFQMDKEYADISMMTHYCYEDKPFIDFKKIKKENLKLPEGYIRERANAIFKYKNFCKEMEINSTNKTLNEPIETDIPTLFIHGAYDSVTPLRDVKEEMKRFKNSKLKVYKTSHSVLGTEEAVEKDVAKFLE